MLPLCFGQALQSNLLICPMDFGWASCVMNQPTDNPDPVVWIVSTGTEILQGHYADSNAPWLSTQLLAMGLSTQRHMALPDKAARLRDGLAEAARQADLVITTGGLGPTGDDLNRQVIADIWGRPLVENDEAWQRIIERFERRGRPVVANNRVQALIPAGAAVLQNDHGTAPGFYLRPEAGGPRATLVALPGPPHEMKPMFERQAAPLIAEQFCEGRVRLRTLTFHTIGLAESLIDERVRDLFERDPFVNFALLAGSYRVDIRLTLMGPDEATNDALAAHWRALIRERVGAEFIYGEDAETLESVVGQGLRARSQTLATAESCTGGLLAGRITDIAGASDYFKRGFITYSNESKSEMLGVDPALIERHGAVSPQVAAAMARGAQTNARTDWAVSVTGIAGPGGSGNKPEGLVFFGLADPAGHVSCVRQLFIPGRAAVRMQSVQTALDLLRRALSDVPLRDKVAFDAPS